MRAWLSLWSADLLAVGEAIDRLDRFTDGWHIDILDGHFAPELVFGPDFVGAVRRRTKSELEVHLMVADPERWINRVGHAGADVITVHTTPDGGFGASFELIRRVGARPGLGLRLEEPITVALPYLTQVDRILMMNTPLGVRGHNSAAETPARLRALRKAGEKRLPALVVDGGIRSDAIGMLARAGADGVIAGSLVFGAPDPIAALSSIRGLGSSDCHQCGGYVR